MRVILLETVSFGPFPIESANTGGTANVQLWLFLFLVRLKATNILSFRIEINFSVSVVNQEYRVAVHEESVVLFNDVIFKCNIQSHVTDLVTVSGWVDSEGETYSSSRDNYGNCHERRQWWWHFCRMI